MPVWTGVEFQSDLRSASNRPPLAGRPFQSVHFVSVPSAIAAWAASHSSGETTATRLPFTTSFAFGKADRSILPAETSFEPKLLGRTMRACSMSG